MATWFAVRAHPPRYCPIAPAEKNLGPEGVREEATYLSWLCIENDGVNLEEGHGSRSRVSRTREWGDDSAPRLGLPVRIDDRTLVPSDVLVVQTPGRGVDGLADAADDAQRSRAVLRDARQDDAV